MTSAVVHQNKVLHAILGSMKISKENKAVLVAQHTNGRSESSADMTHEERQALINYLNHQKSEKAKTGTVKKPQDAVYRMQMKVFSLCHEMNMRLPNGKIDMDRVNKLCRDRGHKHKDLLEYTRAELPLLITQIEKIVKDYLKNK